MAKYDWKQLEKEYILSEYKTVADFLKFKGISRNGSTQKNTKGWNNKKVNKELRKSEKVIEKVIEKESEKEAQQIVDLKSIANDLALNIIKANTQLEQYIVKNKKKTKKVTYDYKVAKPEKETIEEKESIEVLKGVVDRQGLKMLTSALKDLNDILTDKKENNNQEKDNSFIDALNEKAKEIWEDEKTN